MKLSSEKWSSIVHLDMKSPLITKQTAQHTSHSPQAAQISRKLVLRVQGAGAKPNQQEAGCFIMTHPVDPPGQITSCLPFKRLLMPVPRRRGKWNF